MFFFQTEDGIRDPLWSRGLGDVYKRQASNFAMLSNFDGALDLLEHAMSQGIQYKIKAKKSKSFENLSNNVRFQNLIS